MLITYNKSEGHTDLINQITDYYEPLLSGESPYLKPLSTDLIEQLLASGKIKDEAHRRAQYGKDAIQEQPVGETEIEYGGTPIGELFQSLPLQDLTQLDWFHLEQQGQILPWKHQLYLSKRKKKVLPLCRQ